MSWILLLIQALPTIIDLVMKIMDLIEQLPKAERADWRKRVDAAAKTQIKRKGFGKPTLVCSEGAVCDSLAAIHRELQERLKGKETAEPAVEAKA